MPDTIRKLNFVPFVPKTKIKYSASHFHSKGNIILLKNHWTANRQKICDRFINVAQQHESNVVMGDWERQMFEEGGLNFHMILAKATIAVEAALVGNNGTLRLVVSEAIGYLNDALVAFEKLLDL